jgi:hypothetical protein
MLMICRHFGFNLPLQVLRSAKGFYVGTADENGPVSRDSVEYWSTVQEAALALQKGTYTQRENP